MAEVLLIHSDTSDGSTTFVDSSASAYTLTPTNCTHEDTTAKFGATSMYFGGSGGLTIPGTNADLLFAGDFTIDQWVYPTGGGSLSLVNYASANNFHALYLDSATSGRVLIAGVNNITGIVLTANTWQHFALVRSGTELKAYINGVQSGTTGTRSGGIGNSVTNYIGRSTSIHYGNGYIDELRIDNGTAVWTADFTPPTAAYGIVQVETPVIDPTSGDYTGTQSISITCATSGADIYYTTDGSTPDSGDNLYSAAFDLSSDATIKAIGIKAGDTDSDVVTEVYTITLAVADPVILPTSGEYVSTQLVSISCATSDATIYYTEDGSTPDSSDTEYVTSFALSSDKTVKAIGTKTGLANSSVISETYTIAASSDWKSETGPWDFTPSVVKNQYNEGNLISDSSNPVWSSVHTGTPITDTHTPCGYWPVGYSEPVVPDITPCTLPTFVVQDTGYLRAQHIAWSAIHGGVDHGRFISVDYVEKKYRVSDDGGATWTSILTDNSRAFAYISYYNNVWFMCGGSIYYQRSTDGGVTWTEYTHSHTIYKIEWSTLFNLYVLNSFNPLVAGDQLYTSNDGGFNWTLQYTSGNYVMVTSTPLSIGNKGYMYVGNDNTLLVSDNEITTWVGEPTNPRVDVKWAMDGNLILFGNHAYNGTSYTQYTLNGVTATLGFRTINYDSNLRYIAYTGTKFYQSNDGIDWAIVPSSQGGTPGHIVFGKDRFISVDSNFHIVGILTTGSGNGWNMLWPTNPSGGENVACGN